MAGPGVPDWSEIEVEVDRNAGRVTLSMEGYEPRTAVYLGDQGCTLSPKGAEDVYFEPEKVAPGLPDAATQPWPMGDKVEKAPLPPGIDKDALESALDFAFDNSQHRAPQVTRAIVVVHKGRIVAERYASGFDKDTRHICWSMGKSITSALIGVLVGRGKFKVTDPAPIEPWRKPGDPRGAITIAHLLRMNSGLDFTSANPLSERRLTDRDHHTYVYCGAVNVFENSISRPLEFSPGTHWRYRNCDPLSLGKSFATRPRPRANRTWRFPNGRCSIRSASRLGAVRVVALVGRRMARRTRFARGLGLF